MNRFHSFSLAFFLFLAAMPLLAQNPASGREGHPPGMGRPADTGDVRYFGIRIINSEDRTFRYELARETPARERPNRKAGGGGNWRPMFTGYDTKVVRFTDSTIIPLKAGRTPLVITYPQYRDTVELVIEKVGRNLTVDYDRASLAGAWRGSLYSASTRDTAGRGAFRRVAGSISVGMPIEQAKSLMAPATPRILPGRPGTLIYAIDRHRTLYIEEKEERVAKVWVVVPAGE